MWQTNSHSVLQKSTSHLCVTAWSPSDHLIDRCKTNRRNAFLSSASTNPGIRQEEVVERRNLTRTTQNWEEISLQAIIPSACLAPYAPTPHFKPGRSTLQSWPTRLINSITDRTKTGFTFINTAKNSWWICWKLWSASLEWLETRDLQARFDLKTENGWYSCEGPGSGTICVEWLERGSAPFFKYHDWRGWWDLRGEVDVR